MCLERAPLGGRYADIAEQTTLVAATAAILGIALGAGPRASAAIGPDAFGYRADSVEFRFEDISSSGTPILASHDDAFQEIALPFSFSFYGTPYDSVFVSTNGLLSFEVGTAAFANRLLAGSLSPDVPIAAVLWDDWVTFASALDAIHYQTVGAAGSRRLVVQWHVVQRFPGTPSTVTFQAVLHERGAAIEYRYLDTDSGDASASGAGATVGIRDRFGSADGRHLQWSHDEAVITSASAIRFSTNEPPDCTSATASPGSLWPPNHKLREVRVGGATDPDGDDVTVTITGVTQDEPEGRPGDGATAPDVVDGASPNEVRLRAERAGSGDGRVYSVAFSASDGKGGSCTGTARVGVPRSLRT